MLKSPYPWFGGKSRVASAVWDAFGNVRNYVEPFFGSGAVLLSRPFFGQSESIQCETVNDKDGFVANFWRALQANPKAVAHWADWPVNEIDLEARHGWLSNRKERLSWSLQDPDFFDAKVAGWWVWGISQWIGSGWCCGKGKWVSDGAHIRLRKLNEAQDGSQISFQLKRPSLGNAGKGIHSSIKSDSMPEDGDDIHVYLHALASRMRKVRVACGDWSRVMGDSVTLGNGVCGVFLDPPYADTAERDQDLYSEDSLAVAHDVREWCIKNGDNKNLRIVLCGYEGEHQMPESWRVQAWDAGAGYGCRGVANGSVNGKKERLWFSPHCLVKQAGLFDTTTSADLEVAA